MNQLIFLYFYFGVINCENIGTVLFSRADIEKECWSTEELTLLNSRKMFQQILPKQNALEIKDDNCIDELIVYFQMVLKKVKNRTDGPNKHSRELMMTAMADTVGGYLYSIALPKIRNSFYKGVVSFESVTTVDSMFEEIKLFLKTNGEGWKKPTFQQNVTAQEIPLEKPHTKANICEGLIYQTIQTGEKKRCFEIPLPLFDSISKPTAIAVPFKSYSLRNIESKSSAYILVKYYVASMKCFMHINAGSKCVARYNKRFGHWINTHVLPRLKDPKTYAAFGGVLRIMETIKNCGVGRLISKKGGNTKIHKPITITPKTKSSKNNIILVALLVTIFVWFLIGSIFICYRLTKAKTCGESYNMEVGTSTTAKTSFTTTKKTSTDFITSSYQRPSSVTEKNTRTSKSCLTSTSNMSLSSIKNTEKKDDYDNYCESISKECFIKPRKGSCSPDKKMTREKKNNKNDLRKKNFLEDQKSTRKKCQSKKKAKNKKDGCKTDFYSIQQNVICSDSNDFENDEFDLIDLNETGNEEEDGGSTVQGSPTIECSTEFPTTYTSETSYRVFSEDNITQKERKFYKYL